jgi:hypothetical protein
MIEINTKIKYFAITGLHRFSPEALEAVSLSLVKNKGLKVLDLKRTSKEAFQILNESNLG